MDIQSLESRNGGRDWPVIVQSVECRRCLAPEGEPCRNLTSGGSNPMLQSGGPRPDWHVERKYDAAQLWNQREAAPKPEPKKRRKSAA